MDRLTENIIKKINELNPEEFQNLITDGIEDIDGFTYELNIDNGCDINENMEIIENFEPFNIETLVTNYTFFTYEFIMLSLEKYLSTDEYNEFEKNVIFELEFK